MKFEEKLKIVRDNNYHLDKIKIYQQIDNNINNIKTNFIFYGRKNIGKYSQALYFISKYSKNNLRYKKKIQVDNGKFIYNILLSDVHYEIDMDYFSHNSKSFWFSILNVIRDSSIIENNKKFIICKNFHKIPRDILTTFYSNINTYNNLIFILLCENICFLPENILNCCLIIPFKISDRINNKIIVKKNNINQDINNKILEIVKGNKINYSKLRENIYEIFIKHYDIYELFWFIIKDINFTEQTIININKCCYLYNNNYRPIYHIERLILLMHIEYNNYKDKI